MKKTLITIFLLLIVANISIQKKSDQHKPVKVFLIGDSTVADYTLDGNYQEKRFPLTGWGQVFQSFMRKDSIRKVSGLIRVDSVIVDDRARGGRSTRTFFQEGRWRAVYNDLKKNDLVLMQFGHNDAATNFTERYVNIEGYKEFLRLFVMQTREKGATPILLTPVNCDYPWEEGVLKSCHGDYPQAVKDVATEMNVLMIDLTQLSCDFFTRLGEDFVSTKYFMNLPEGAFPAYPKGQKDDTHFQPAGAKAVAQLVFDAMKKMKL